MGQIQQNEYVPLKISISCRASLQAICHCSKVKDKAGRRAAFKDSYHCPSNQKQIRRGAAHKDSYHCPGNKKQAGRGAACLDSLPMLHGLHAVAGGVAAASSAAWKPRWRRWKSAACTTLRAASTRWRSQTASHVFVQALCSSTRSAWGGGLVGGAVVACGRV